MQVIRNKVLQYYQLFCNLSLDVVGGVLCNMFAVAACFRLNPPLAWYIALPAGTWLIYLADHLVDVIRVKEEYPTPRHRFIKKNLKAIAVLCLSLIALILYLAFAQYDKLLFISGCIVAGITLLHFVLSRINPQSRSVLNNKEFGVSLIYATSVFIYPIAVLLQTDLLDVVFYLYAVFLLITYQNLLLCSIIEYPYDVAMNNTSFIRSAGLGIGKLVFIGVSLSAALFILVILLGFDFYKPSLLA